MKATAEQLSALIDLQNLDREILQLNKELANLPQKQAILQAREKIAALSKKKEQVLGIKKKTEAKFVRATEEDEHLAEKERATQEAINELKGDYRSVESRTKELNGFAKRRSTLASEIDALDAELKKVEGVEAQVNQLLSQVEAEEQKAVASYQAEGGAIREKAIQKQGARTLVTKQISPDLLTLYEKTASRCGGVALGRLTDGHCSVCRSVIEGGRLIDLQHQAPLGVCPTCKRLLII